MGKTDREAYIFEKRSLLVLLFLYYLADVSYDAIVLRSFGFQFGVGCNFKAIITSKHNHYHKYSCRIINDGDEVIDEMGNVNIIKVKNIEEKEYDTPSKALNIYFDGASFVSLGKIEGREISYKLSKAEDDITDSLLYYFISDPELVGLNTSAPSFLLWVLKLYTYQIHTDLVIGAGINEDYGAKSWPGLIEALNNEFYKGDYRYASEIKTYVGKELFTDPMVLETTGFDSFKSLNRELYKFSQAKSFDDQDSTLSHCVNYIKKHRHTSVITYNYDTNLEYLLKKRGISYNTTYNDSSFVNMKAKADIFHVHGLLPYDKYDEKNYTESLIFNESEYYYLYNNPYSWNNAKQLHDFKFNTCLFIGISLTDPDMKRLLELAVNSLKFNFIFLKKKKGFSETTFRDLTSYFFTFDLIVIWVDEYSEIADYLEAL